MGLFGKKKPTHNPDDVALVMEITGFCNRCRHRGSARLTAYYSGEVLIRCNNCKTANAFDPDDNSYNDPKKFAPFRNDEDDDDTIAGRMRRGR